MPDFVIQLEEESAEGFLSRVRLANELWAGPEGKWGFRGQADASWHLRASAFRSDFRDRLFMPYENSQLPPEAQQAFAELQVFLEFFRAADSIGLHVPGSDYLLGVEFEQQAERFNGRNWPFPQIVAGLAIAQHHGIPTRLLDFSMSPAVAAFFAASSRMEGDDFQDNRFSVWALNLLFTRNAWPTPRFNNRWLEIVQVPTAENLFLNRQRGFFIFPVKETMPQDEERYDIDEIVPLRARNPKHVRDLERCDVPLREMAAPLLYQISTPASNAREVLRRLEREDGVSRATLMPTYDNVTRLLEMKRDHRLF